MNRRLLTCLFLLLVASGLRAQVQFTTENPRVDDVNDADVSIQRVELTAQYTIVYMKFQARKEGYNGRPSPFSIPMPNGRGGELETSNNIGFQPTSRLYVNQASGLTSLSVPKIFHSKCVGKCSPVSASTLSLILNE